MNTETDPTFNEDFPKPHRLLFSPAKGFRLFQVYNFDLMGVNT